MVATTSLRSSTRGCITCWRLKASSCRVSAAARSPARRISSTVSPARIAGVQAFLEKLRVAADRLDDVVEVVGDAAGEAAHRLHLLHALQAQLVALAARAPRPLVDVVDQPRAHPMIEHALHGGGEPHQVVGADVVPGAAPERAQHFGVVGRRRPGHHEHQRRRRRVVADALEQAIREVIGMEGADDEEVARRHAEESHGVGRRDGVRDDRLQIELGQTGEETLPRRDGVVGEDDGKGAWHRARAARTPGSRYPGNRHFPTPAEAQARRGCARARRRAPRAETYDFAFRRSTSVRASAA